MYLNATTDKLEIVLSSPVTSTKLDWNVSWQDINASGMVLPQSAGAGGTNNTTAVTMVAAPGASTTRQVTNINIYNADIVTASVIIQKDVSGVKFILAIYDLASGNTLSWSRENGWQDISGSGSTAIKILNGLGDISQSFDTGTAGSDFNIVSSAGVHTFNFPDADSLNRGLLTPLDWSTFNGKQNALNLTTTGSSGAATLVGNTLNIPNYTGGGVSTIGTIDSQTKAANGAVITGSSLVMQTADATNPGLVSITAQTFKGDKTVDGRLNVLQDTTVTTQVCAVIAANTTNANLVLAPNGTGAIIADIPDGATSGGNARGINAVDLQIFRGSALRIASGNYSFIGSGVSNQASGERSVCVGGDSNIAGQAFTFIGGGQGNNANTNTHATIAGGQSNTASGAQSFVGGGQSNTSTVQYATISGGQSNSIGGFGFGAISGGSSNSIISNRGFIGGGGSNTVSNQFGVISGGSNNVIVGDYGSVSGGIYGGSYLYGQRANSSGAFNFTYDAQTSSITFRRSITGTAITELFLDGASVRVILALPTGATNARAWRAQIDIVAICATAGGTTVLNDVFAGSYHCAIKRVGTATSLVGAVSVTNEVSDASMSTSVVTIDADDTNEALRIQFTPPTTAAAGTVIRVVATAYLTEVGR